VIFLSRRKRGPDPHLDWKVKLFFLGATVAMAGVGLESSLLVGVAIAILLLGVGLRFLPGGQAEDGGDEEDRGGAPSP